MNNLLTISIDLISRLLKNIAVIYLSLRVFNPISGYSGQKLKKLVSTKTAATTSKIMPNVPETTFVKYKIAITAAITSRMILSVLPILAFIIRYFLGFKIIFSQK